MASGDGSKNRILKGSSLDDQYQYYLQLIQDHSKEEEEVEGEEEIISERDQDYV
jgi:hypothetical protein